MTGNTRGVVQQSAMVYARTAARLQPRRDRQCRTSRLLAIGTGGMSRLPHRVLDILDISALDCLSRRNPGHGVCL